MTLPSLDLARATWPMMADQLLSQYAGIADEDLEAIEALMSARTAEQCNDIFRAGTRRFVVDKFACGEIDLERRERKVFYSMQWSESWRRFYFENLLGKDPLLANLEASREPFTWAELKQSGHLTADAKATFLLVNAHGWIDGFVFAIGRGKTQVALLSMATRQPIELKEKAFLAIFGLCYIERMRAVITAADFPFPPLGLTRRELDCLQLASRGMTDRGIASRLQIKTSTAHGYIQQAMDRIGAVTRGEAIAIAVAFGALRA